MKELIETQKEYIELLERCLGENSSFLSIHGISANQEDIKKGEELREKIESLFLLKDK